MISYKLRWFLVACVVELVVLGLALVSSWVFRIPLLSMFRWEAGAFMIGVLGAGPILGLFWHTLAAQKGPLAEIRVFLETVVRPVFGAWSVPELAFLSVLAGIAEEAFFRGVIQAALTAHLGQFGALVFSSLLFGICHAVNRPYAVVTAAIGAYLGLLFLASGNLLAPVITHALYDFAALMYLLKMHRN